MQAARVENWIWVLIYGGLLALVIGWFVTPGNAALGGSLMVAGAVLVVVGALLVWVRSRMHDKS